MFAGRSEPGGQRHSAGAVKSASQAHDDARDNEYGVVRGACHDGHACCQEDESHNELISLGDARHPRKQDWGSQGAGNGECCHELPDMGKRGVARGGDDAGNAHDELLRTTQGKAAQCQNQDCATSLLGLSLGFLPSLRGVHAAFPCRRLVVRAKRCDYRTQQRIFPGLLLRSRPAARVISLGCSDTKKGAPPNAARPCLA